MLKNTLSKIMALTYGTLYNQFSMRLTLLRLNCSMPQASKVMSSSSRNSKTCSPRTTSTPSFSTNISHLVPEGFRFPWSLPGLTRSVDRRSSLTVLISKWLAPNITLQFALHAEPHTWTWKMMALNLRQNTCNRQVGSSTTSGKMWHSWSPERWLPTSLLRP